MELRDLVKRLLERHGYRVLVAANADEALRVFNLNASIERAYHRRGDAGCERRRVDRGSCSSDGLCSKWCYMSGHMEASIANDGVLNPGIRFLHKPFTSETLERKVREALDGPAATRVARTAPLASDTLEARP